MKLNSAKTQCINDVSIYSEMFCNLLHYLFFSIAAESRTDILSKCFFSFASLTVLCIEQKNGIISDGGAEFVNAILGGGGCRVC